MALNNRHFFSIGLFLTFNVFNLKQKDLLLKLMMLCILNIKSLNLRL